ncbi:hypothetical protein CDAR_437771 [Caerostris darwini]|uniref:Uncharacterized protein n=1 Tax=Caerostris darwini TaxID=1538125 RepID=A0AAV4NU97_9ARAC|nr:hypothetical protein CDAR_437771 [Caerostris darwini]
MDLGAPESSFLISPGDQRDGNDSLEDPSPPPAPPPLKSSAIPNATFSKRIFQEEGGEGAVFIKALPNGAKKHADARSTPERFAMATTKGSVRVVCNFVKHDKCIELRFGWLICGMTYNSFGKRRALPLCNGPLCLVFWGWLVP